MINKAGVLVANSLPLYPLCPTSHLSGDQGIPQCARTLVSITGWGALRAWEFSELKTLTLNLSKGPEVGAKEPSTRTWICSATFLLKNRSWQAISRLPTTHMFSTYCMVPSVWGPCGRGQGITRRTRKSKEGTPARSMSHQCLGFLIHKDSYNTLSTEIIDIMVFYRKFYVTNILIV